MKKNIYNIFLFLLFILFLFACAAANKKEINTNTQKIKNNIADQTIDATTILKKNLLSALPTYKQLQAPVKCEILQNNKTNKLYGDFIITENTIQAKLYSALNYAKIEISGDTQILKITVNGKTETADTSAFDTLKIFELINFIFTNRLNENAITDDIKKKPNNSNVLNITLWNKVLAVFDNLTNEFLQLDYNKIQITFKKYFETQKNKVPIELQIISNNPDNIFTAKIWLAKNKILLKE